MPTYPAPADPLAALTRAGGTTEPHSRDHGRMIGAVENVERHGADGDGVTVNTGAFEDAQDALPASGGTLRFGPGTFIGTLTLRANVAYQGAGRGATGIGITNGYAFQTPATGSLDRVTIQDMSLGLVAGSTSGGAIKAVSNSYHSNWSIYRVDAGGVSTATDPIVHLDGFIGSHLDDMRIAGGGGDGVKVTSSGFVSNAYSLERLSVQACALSATTYAGIRIVGGAGARIGRSIVEQCHGHGIYLDLVNKPEIGVVWFEDLWNTSLHIENSTSYRVSDTFFKYHNASAAATARHIKLVRSSAAQRDQGKIDHNSFLNSPASGVAIDVGTNVEQTLIADNRGTSVLGNTAGGTILDNGKYTKIINNDLDPMTMTGNGTPSGVVTAPIGSVYLDAGAAYPEPALWVKITGTGNTVWSPLVVGGGAANPDTSGATLAALETEVNQIKQLLRDGFMMAP